MTTWLSSHTTRSKPNRCFRSSLRPTLKISSLCTRMEVCKPLWKKWHGEATPREKPHFQNLSPVFFPTLGSIQRSVHRLSQFPTYAWLLCLRGPRLAIGRRRRGLHQRGSGLDSRHRWRSRKGLQRENVFLTLKTGKGSQSFQRSCCREDRFDPFVAHFSTHQTKALPLLVSIHARPTGVRPVRVLDSASVSDRTPPCPTNTVISSDEQL